MLNYKCPNNDSIDLNKLSLAVRAGHASIRPDLRDFTETILFRWLRNGLWPALNCTLARSSDIKVQCSEDMVYLGVEEDLETKIMLRRIARIRLYYWYEEEKENMRRSETCMELDRGIDIRTRSIDAFLEYFFADWKTADKEKKNLFVAGSTSRKIWARGGVNWFNI